MTESNQRELIVASNGQLSISSEALKALKLHKGDCLVEIVVGNCIVLLPRTQILRATVEHAQEAIRRAGIDASEIIYEADKASELRVSEQYPEL